MLIWERQNPRPEITFDELSLLFSFGKGDKIFDCAELSRTKFHVYVDTNLNTVFRKSKNSI